ncbi:MAG: hypothetical protein CBC16_02810 [Verrucomicrobia bacterium TMED56]|nr:MAG: hypothetical protein CBC16_02810 [Verrucomicrobia bacterium TMED56]|tara:strand:- start:69 stop:482 length:414 start_codon:yes stop_codon:yes gene_type:complete
MFGKQLFKDKYNKMTGYTQPTLWCNELNAGNLEPLLECYSNDAILFATFKAEPITTPQGIRDYFTAFLAREEAGVKFDESTTIQHDISENVYSCNGLYEFFYCENEELIRHAARFTFIVEVDHKHLIRHHHSSIIPT